MLNVFLLQSRFFEQDHRARDGAVGEIVQVDGGHLFALAHREKSFRGWRAQGSLPVDFHVW